MPIYVKSMPVKVIQKTWTMTPTWSQNGGRNQSKIHWKTIQKTSRKMKRPKAMGAESPWAWRAGRGKEFLRRLQVRFPSCKSSTSTHKHTPGIQLKNEQTSKNLWLQVARTWRAGWHGADLLIYWAQGPPRPVVLATRRGFPDSPPKITGGCFFWENHYLMNKSCFRSK